MGSVRKEILTYWLLEYLVGFWICGEISELLKKNQLEKYVFSKKKLHASTRQNFARQRFFAVNGIEFSWEIDVKTGESIWKDLQKL